MADDDKVAGAIAGVMKAATETAEGLREHIEKGRARAMKGTQAVFDTERLTFYVEGKHPTLVGIEGTMAVPLADLLSMLAPVLPTVIVPILLAAGQNVKKLPPGKRS